ncbi:DUF4810 domain-containing protein [Pseudorhodoferax sp. Leaf274]|uniref:DUF4810 domain-containing protein n=1 Tax=Pseudorhodoferax sp. Leaf274 TaxID=1736318 RepID=UPI000A84F34B|nr:DUF4810 domain-containing protein [Pseudorhodoferax sp. Leaf274]
MSRTSSMWRALPLAGALLLSACAAPNKPLYLWDGFPRQQYEVLQRTGADANAQIQAMQAQAEKARAAGAALPPGFRAHLGMLQLSVGAADQARASWQAEKVAFPESAPYMNQLLRRLDGGAVAPPTNGNPS